MRETRLTGRNARERRGAAPRARTHSLSGITPIIARVCFGRPTSVSNTVRGRSYVPAKSALIWPPPLSMTRATFVTSSSSIDLRAEAAAGARREKVSASARDARARRRRRAWGAGTALLTRESLTRT